ncbi:435_t:CDS:10 [Diversispora eburnea]|uniref:435_t:CDS:1 n=1 Tax=Diversispora eburnea TaxID=1213867 RepID=A0A9N9A922_9GLOM|nr:435_t:CDS:10 [Diversispora eburnea]
MGKVEKIKKFKPPKPTPIIEENRNSEEDSNGRVLPVIEQLSSPEATERAWAASSASNLVMGDSKTRYLLLSNNLISILIERLTDSVYEVVNEALGTLRNLTIVDNVEVCVEMYDKDILTPLMMLASKGGMIVDNILREMPPESDPIKDARKTIWNFIENIICIIWSLSETSQKILRGINNANFIPFLMSCLINSEKIPISTVLVAAQCLHTMTDDNPDIYLHFEQNHQYIQVLLNGIKVIKIEENSPLPVDDLLLIRVLYCGILSNFSSIYIPSEPESDPIVELNLQLIPVLASCLTLDINKVAEDAIALFIKNEENNIGIDHPIDTSIVEEKLNDEDDWQDDLCEGINDIECSTNFLSMEDNDIPMMDVNNRHEISTQNMSILNLLTTDILPHLFRLANPIHLSFPEQFYPSQSIIASTIISSLVTVHMRSVECLNNYLLTMAETIEGKSLFTEHVSDAKQMWIWLFELFNKFAGNGVKVEAKDFGQEKEMWSKISETLVGCLWTLSRGLDCDVPLETKQIQILIDYFNSSVSESMNVKIIGTLGVIARRQNAVDDNKVESL